LCTFFAAVAIIDAQVNIYQSLKSHKRPETHRNTSSLPFTTPLIYLNHQKIAQNRFLFVQGTA